MTRPPGKGWCPGAHRPMLSGDGLIVRVRPSLGRFTAKQVFCLCAAAMRHGSGILEVTSRANLQLRGVSEAGHAALFGELERLGLLDPDPEIEARRNLLVAPLWQPGDPTHRIAAELVGRLAELPPLPAKFGFAVDAGGRPMLADASADIRIERCLSGGLILRADGAKFGRAVCITNAAAEAIALARWFAETGGGAQGRMARHLSTLPPSQHPAAAEAMVAPITLRPGATPLGPVVGVAFGQVAATDLARLLRESGARALRLTPWRLILLEGGRLGSQPGFLTDPCDPLLRIDACPGTPHCPASTVATRALARSLAPYFNGTLHVSGCAKGCARARPADFALVGRDGRFDLVIGGRAWDKPTEIGLSPDALLSRYGPCDAPPV